MRSQGSRKLPSPGFKSNSVYLQPWSYNSRNDQIKVEECFFVSSPKVLQYRQMKTSHNLGRYSGLEYPKRTNSKLS